MNCREPILLVFQEAAILWIFPCFAASAIDPDEAQFGQRQPCDLGSRNSVASAIDPMKLAKVKGNHETLDAGIQLPLPLTQ